MRTITLILILLSATVASAADMTITFQAGQKTKTYTVNLDSVELIADHLNLGGETTADKAEAFIGYVVRHWKLMLRRAKRAALEPDESVIDAEVDTEVREKPTSVPVE